MELLRLLLLFLHVLGLAVLIGSFAVQFPPPRGGRSKPHPLMLHGALAQLVTGIGLVMVGETLSDQFNTTKALVKLAVLLVVLTMILVGRRRPMNAGVFSTIGLLAVTNIGVAVFWV